MNPPIQSGTVAAAATPFKIPGRLAHKWVEDFLEYGLADEPSFRVGCPAVGKSHHLEAKLDQCVATDLRNPGKHYIIIVSAICVLCRHHFIFRVTAPTGQLCGQSHGNPQKPLHHLIATTPISEDFEPCSLDRGRNPKYLTCGGHAAYRCSTPGCSYRVNIEISEPRVTAEHAHTLLDDAAVKLRLQNEIQETPERFSGTSDENRAIDYLSQYLTDTLTPPQSRRGSKIKTRNVKFAVQFGDGESANRLFEFLEFKKGIDNEECAYWELPELDFSEHAPTLVPSQKSFYQDVRAEIWCLKGVYKWPGHDSNMSFDRILRDAFHCSHKDAAGLEFQDSFASADTGKSHFNLLGLTSRSHWKIFRYAYECQTRVDKSPAHREQYLNALQRISAPYNQDELNFFIATEHSRIDAQQFDQYPSVNQPESVLSNGIKSIDSTESGEISVDAIIGEYRNKVQNSLMSPTKETGARKRLDLRSELLKVATSHPEGPKLKEIVREPMDLDEALVCLDLPVDTEQLKSMDVTVPEAMAQVQVEQGKNAFLTGMALQAIGKFLNNDVLVALAATMMGEQPQNRVEQEPVNDPNLPAGLDNLRNTCYLNSMLQYFFTINPVRDLILNFDEYKLPDNEESRSSRRVTTEARGISAKQAYVANELANELRSLFSDLISTQNHYATPTQRLALAAMKNTDQLEARARELEARPGDTGAQAIGPLPDPNGTKGQTPDSGMVYAGKAPDYAAPAPPVRPNGGRSPDGITPEQTETSSDVSSHTLVNVGPNDYDNDREVSSEWNPLMQRVNSVRSNASSDNSMRCEVNEDDLMEQQIDSSLGKFNPVGSGKDVEMFDASSSQTVSESAAVQAAATALAGLASHSVSTEPEDEISRIKRALDDKTIKGTDQEDVQEAMDKMLFNLRSAIKPTGTEPLGPKAEAQTDAVTEILRLIKVEYQKPLNKAKWELTTPTTEDFLLAYPARSGNVDLHEAIERGFMRQISENPKEPENPFLSFSSIRRFPPILHICIQRTVYDQSARAGKKIDVSIQLPQVLYMDRYKESAPGDALWMRRHKYWDHLELEDPKVLAARRKLEQKKPGTADADTAMTEAQDAAADELEAYHNEAVNEANGSDSNHNQTSVIDLGDETDSEAEAEAKRKKYEDTFDDLRDHEYHLHAVICHGGSTGASGHYWVWIYDFEQRVWYNYNDRTVRVHRDNEKVLKDLSASDQPYYIAYVRRDNLDLVSIPRRADSEQAKQPEMCERPMSPPPTPTRRPASMAAAGTSVLDVEMTP
ncbi:hypothetical protein PpBr36_08265 [Pyricularia pennisetigena]|uniref:hypothetical protein n=1 Tax=Pyricularia pennisetigena TaxID=1578925 RepID=UPI001152B844|nr:hypothetical protein PpBr36_08265 [Pyricularia pennisetigena]TLS23968.1 hypothetical protein PpBr36_08265 [Pyricularia pennisetigena]